MAEERAGMQRAEQLAPSTWCCAMKSAAKMGRDNRQRNVTVISFAFRKSTILSSLLPKNQRSSLIYFQKKTAAPEISDHLSFPSKKIRDPLSFSFQKTASSLFLLKRTASPKISDPLYFYFKKNSILSFCTSKKN